MILNAILIGNLLLISNILTLIISFLMAYYYHNQLNEKNEIIRVLEKQHNAKLEVVNSEYIKNLNNIRTEIEKKEMFRNKQSFEFEREILQALNGVSLLLNLTDEINKIESDKIIEKLNEIQAFIENQLKK